jgi:hypothetical protein
MGGDGNSSNQLFQPGCCSLKDRIGMERRSVLAPELECGVPERDGNLKGIHGRDHGEELTGGGVFLALIRFGVSAAPGAIPEGDLGTLEAGGVNFGADTDFGHLRLLLIRKSAK